MTGEWPKATRSSSSGAREHNLKDISLELPRDALVVITGLSGSGKSSLAFDTIYAEGQRRYVESLSAYARQFLGQMDKPDVDSIEGLSPAISIDQKTTSRNPRSTVGTVDRDLRLPASAVGARGQAALPDLRAADRRPVGRADHRPGDGLAEGTRFMVLAPVVRGRKGEYGKLLEELRADGFARVKIDGRVRMLEESIVLDKRYKHDISVVVDRLAMRHDIRKRLADSIETAVGLADGLVEIEIVGSSRSENDGDGDGVPAPGEGQAHSSGALGVKAANAQIVPGREARARDAVHLLREVRLPRARTVAGRAGAAHLLLQLPPRRVRALHGARLANGDRPRAGRARPDPVGRRGRDRAVGEQCLQLLRAGDRGDRQALQGRPGDAVGGTAAGASRPVLDGNERRAAADHLPQPLRAHALLRHALRGGARQSTTALSRDRLGVDAREDRGVHVAARLPGVRWCALAARVARGARRGHAHRGLLRALGAAGTGLARGGRALGDRQARGAPDPARDLRAPAVPGERGHRLPVDGPRRLDAVGRRGAAYPPGHADRLVAGGGALHPRRALDRLAPARQREADRDARAPARSWQHGDRRRARRADDALRRPSGRSGAGRRRARRLDRRAGNRRAGAEGQAVVDRPVPGGYAHDRAAGETAHSDRLCRDSRRKPAQPARRRRAHPARHAHLRHRRVRLGQVDARQRSALQGGRQPPAPRADSVRAPTARSTASTSSTRSSPSTSRRSGARRARTRPRIRACST